MSKDLIAAKESASSLKKKMKRLEEENNGYKGDLRKATEMAEDRLEEYIRNDQQTQRNFNTTQNKSRH